MKLLGALLLAGLLEAQPYDLVILRGRVLDPARNLDAKRAIGIRVARLVEIWNRGSHFTSPLAKPPGTLSRCPAAGRAVPRYHRIPIV
jgi:hypothetical protein